MRVLQETDLRWVSGGYCTSGHADKYDVQAAEGECIFAQMAVDSAYYQYSLRVPSDPDYTACYNAWQGAIAGLDAANSSYNAVATDNVSCPSNHYHEIYELYDPPHSW